MRYYGGYKRVIATKEKVSGNDSVGSMWLETKSFAPDTKISEILEWAKDCDGKLIITIDHTDSSLDVPGVF